MLWLAVVVGIMAAALFSPQDPWGLGRMERLVVGAVSVLLLSGGPRAAFRDITER